MKKPITVDSNTYASNPGNVTFKPTVWFKYHSRPIIISGLVALGLLILFSSISFHTGFVLFSIISVSIYYKYKRKKEHFELGDSNGGLVISEEPKLLAIRTDLSKGFGNYPVIKIIEYKGDGKLNDIVGTVALYTNSNDELPHWDDFMPIPIEYATDNAKEISIALRSYPKDQKQIINSYLERVPKPLCTGLFKIKINEHNWND